MELIDQLRAGDEAAFSQLVERLHPQLVRIARRFVQTDAAAQDVAQDTWTAVLQQLDAFEGRSALSTWITQIAINKAKTRGVNDQRTRPVEDATEFDRLDQWKTPPGGWTALPETLASNKELVKILQIAMDALPEQQRLVVSLRDVEGLSPKETCDIMQISEENQRVLLHRARTKLRAALEAAIAVVKPQQGRQVPVAG